MTEVGATFTHGVTVTAVVVLTWLKKVSPRYVTVRVSFPGLKLPGGMIIENVAPLKTGPYPE
jgi:hypothetical protein